MKSQGHWACARSAGLGQEKHIARHFYNFGQWVVRRSLGIYPRGDGDGLLRFESKNEIVIDSVKRERAVDCAGCDPTGSIHERGRSVIARRIAGYKACSFVKGPIAYKPTL